MTELRDWNVDVQVSLEQVVTFIYASYRYEDEYQNSFTFNITLVTFLFDSCLFRLLFFVVNLVFIRFLCFGGNLILSILDWGFVF